MGKKKSLGFACVNEIDFENLDLFPVKGGFTLNLKHTWKNGVVFKFRGFDGGFPKKGEPVWVVFSTDVRVNYSEPKNGETHIRILEEPTALEPGSIESPFGKKHTVFIYKYDGQVRPNKRGNTLRLLLAKHAIQKSKDGSEVEGKLRGAVVYAVSGETISSTGSTGERHHVVVAENGVELVVTYSTVDNKRTEVSVV